jgi:hypothetical protein
MLAVQKRRNKKEGTLLTPPHKGEPMRGSWRARRAKRLADVFDFEEKGDRRASA